jgi:hypothetical protein
VPAGYARVTDAVFAAGPGDTIRVAAGTYSPATNGEAFPIALDKNGLVLLGAGMGLSVLDAANTNYGVLVSAPNVRVSGFTITRGRAYRGGGIYVATTSLGASLGPQIDRNLILACGATDRGAGIWAEDATNAWIHHNVVWQSYDVDPGVAADPHGIQLQQANGLIEHNLIGRGDSNGLFNGGANSNPVVRNNIVAWNGTFPTKGRGFCALGGASTVVANNLFFANALPAMLVFIDGVPTDLSAADANAASPTDSIYGNFEADPLLVNADALDFHLQSASPAIDAGAAGSGLDPDGTPVDVGPFYFHQATVGVDPVAGGAGAIALAAAFPNPFGMRTTLAFSTARAGRVTVTVVNGRGARVATLHDAWLAPGPHTATWDGRAENGPPVATGVYFARVALDGETATQKLLFVR